ncbi:MAG: circadian clock KaiB family protein [Pseudomonadota bacterium]
MNEFKMFIAVSTVKTRKIVSDIEIFLTMVFGKEYTLRVIEVIQDPQTAREDGILATPTLVKTKHPMTRVFGDFSDMKKVLKGLGISLPPDAPGTGTDNEGLVRIQKKWNRS